MRSDNRTAAKPKYNVALGYLRAFVVVLVLAFHAVIAYCPFAYLPPTSLAEKPRAWQGSPVVDPAGWSGFELFFLFTDIFFMSLMFFLSGLFVWKSLRRKGAGRFLRDRALRLGVPLLVLTPVLPLVAYYPTYLTLAARPSPIGFWRDWRTLGEWPIGPLWFVGLLLAFDGLAAGLFVLLPRWGDALGQLLARISRRPAVFFLLLVAVSAIAYVPLAVAFHPFDWTWLGPLRFQSSRPLHYAVYFFIGVGVGAGGVDQGMLSRHSKLTRRWPFWTFAALAVFALALDPIVGALTSETAVHFWRTLGGFAFVLSCAASCFAFLALFQRFAQTPRAALDSLRDNAYGMYLIHFPMAGWLQYALLGLSLAAVAKGSIVFFGTLLASWGTTAAIRRIPAAARVL